MKAYLENLQTQFKQLLFKDFKPTYDLVDAVKYHKPKLLITKEVNLSEALKIYENEIIRLQTELENLSKGYN